MHAVPATFLSYAQNREDVVLWRALRHVENGRYVEVGANDPSLYSISRGFYEQGWSGITVEPLEEFVELHRRERPRDHQVRAAVTDADTDEVVLHRFPGTGLSTLDADVSAQHLADGREGDEVRVPARRLDDVLTEGTQSWADREIHFLVVDVEGAEPVVLRSLDLERWRPWVVVIESTAPLSTEQTHQEWEPLLLDHGYEYTFFDGLSRFYVAREHADLKPALSYPACPHDVYDTAHDKQQRELVEELTEEVIRWRADALSRWAWAVDAAVTAAEPDEARVAALRAEIEAMRQTLSWRVTAPLRAVRKVLPR